ncbi:DEAD/DEAH box helicase [Zunongwangia sp. HRR-M8]|uniref:DEAD/DEAH box helicase n=1 Tax=Zunongwangia sp. HRR-M8 TaxID=3015170 RepID=UPI0022DD8572|nr:DEAD/DEAH box helicase family protein [Zunongwangia sp. HRR-M8]WBL20876.1 DEAD/DEAH box helicase family protein [Zunongwangia sp. HRR-M8]
MSYFENLYPVISYPVNNKLKGSKGLRNAQLGAIHSIAAHFTIYQETIGLIVMPTGSGKTGVINMAPFVLRSKRVLVLSSSVLVRGQIFEEFDTLKTLKNIKVFSKDVKTPEVMELRGSLKQKNEWEKMRNFDVVVTIPINISNSIKNNNPPPEELFDLVIVDEAHHSTAETWNKTIKYFKNAKKIFFTATPFRNDKLEVEGKIIYKYSLSQAYKDGIFGDIGYIPVNSKGNSSIDLAIAKEAEKVFNDDNSKPKINHKLMIRTEGKDHAKELLGLYKAKTNLNLKIVNSSYTYKTIKKAIKDLREDKLDGIICNNMLGEGFDFPNLKIAAIHKPHGSLPITLQFIGRFARTNSKSIGDAKFIAPISDIQITKRNLYHEENIWQKIIHEISDEAIDQIDEIKQSLDTFETVEEQEGETDFSMFNLYPYFHIKIYRANTFLINEDLPINGHQILYHKISEDLQAVIFVTREDIKPKWVRTHDLDDHKHHMFIIFYDQTQNLLFITSSSIRSEGTYKLIGEVFTGDDFEKLSKSEINKILLDMSGLEIFSLGMGNRSPQDGESYRQFSGKNTGSKVKPSDAKLHFAGHIFTKAIENNKEKTIGYSSNSKVWSHQYEQIPTLINWCKSLGTKINSEREVRTNSGYDYLANGKIISKFPEEIIYASWHKDTYADPFELKILENEELIHEISFFECYIEPKNLSKDKSNAKINFCSEKFSFEISYNFKEHFELIIPDNIQVYTGDGESFEDYLNNNSIQFILGDFSNIIDHELYRIPDANVFNIDMKIFRSLNWEKENIDIYTEFFSNEKDMKASKSLSIHDGIKSQLQKDNSLDFILYDHGAFELADYIAVKNDNGKINFILYHIKKAGGKPSLRVGDVDEVLSQCIRCTNWLSNKKILIEKLKKRLNGKEDKFVKGKYKELMELLNNDYMFNYTIVLVQPGISGKLLENPNKEGRKVSNVLAHLDSSVQQAGAELAVIGSI